MKNALTSLLLAGTVATLVPLTAAAQTAPKAAKAPAAAPATQAAPALRGTVADSLSQQPLAFATVVLRPATEGQPAISTLTNEQGAFSFDALPAGAYALTVQYLGYRKSAPVAVQVGETGPAQSVAVTLAPEKQQIKGVTVTGTRAFIEQHADKLVLNVAASPLAAGGNAADLLGRAPGVLEQNGGYVLRGKNVVVLLDGKYTNLSGEELKNMLAALPSSAVAQVEVMANPPARYDAQGGAVINIVSTKSRSFGTNGSLTLGVGTGRYLRYNGGLSLNHRTQKLNVYGGLDHLASQPYNTLNSVRPFDPGVSLVESTRGLRQLHGNTLRLGFDYDLSPRTSLGVLVRGLLNSRDQETFTRTDLVNSRELVQSTEVSSSGHAQVLSPSVNVYYKTKLDSLGQKTLSLSADYFGYRKDWQAGYQTRYLDATGADAFPLTRLLDNSPGRNSVRSFSADYAQPLRGGKLEAGLKTTFTTTDSDIRWEQATADGPWTVDPGKTNHFIYRENINAAYASYARPFGPKLNVQVGLRAEQTNTTGTSLTLDQTNRRSYLNVFPSASLSYTKSANHQFGLAYREKIDRFRFGIVNPFVTYISQYSYVQGNPGIRPSLSHNFELTHTYKQGLLTSALSYGHHTSVLMETFRKDAATNVVVNSYQNFRSAETLDASVTLMKALLDNKWTSYTTLGASYARLGASSGLQGARPSVFLSTNHTITLPQNFKLEVAGSYMSPLTYGGLAFKSRYGLDLGVSKTVMQGAGTFALNVSDVLNTQRNRYEVQSFGVQSMNVGKAETRFVRLSFNYKFGNRQVKASKRRDTGVEGEKGRMELN